MVKQWQKMCKESLKKSFLECEKIASRNIFRHFFDPRDFFHVVLLISNHTVFLVQFVKKQIDVSFSRVCPVIDNEFRHNIAKVVCGIASWILSHFDNVTMKFMINYRTDTRKTDLNLLNRPTSHMQRCKLQFHVNAYNFPKLWSQ